MPMPLRILVWQQKKVEREGWNVWLKKSDRTKRTRQDQDRGCYGMVPYN